MNRRSIQPKRTKPAGAEVDEFYRSLGRPDPELLGALVEGLDEQELIAQSNSEAPATPQLLQDALASVMRAYSTWQKLPSEKRAKLHGCTLQLFAIAAEQVRKLQQLRDQQLARAAEQEKARGTYDQLVVHGKLLCGQAKSVLHKVAGSRPGAQSALDEGVGDLTTPPDLARSLRYLAETSKNLLALPASSVRSRAVIFGLNKGLVDSIESLLEQLRQSEQKMNLRLSQLPPEQSLDRTRALVWFLLKHLSDVFTMAHEVDPSIPDLRLVETGTGKALAKTTPAPPAPLKPGQPIVVPAAPKPVVIEKVRIPSIK